MANINKNYISKVRTVVRLALLVFCAILFVAGFVVLNMSIHVSTAFISIVTIVGSAVFAAIILFHKQIIALLKKIRSNRAGRIMTNIMIICVVLAVLYVAVISVMMIVAINTSPPDGDVTLIIHGAQVVDEEPNIILRLRLRAALQFMQDNPESVAVLSGGLGNVATISEGEAMRRFLVSGGISDSRLFVEDRSTSTLENIEFSKIIIEEQNLSRNVAITTDGFHQFRAQSFARDVGLNPSALPSNTPLTSLPFYWLREIAAITTQVIF